MTPKQLKASILQLAIQGKLVPQDPNDEPASELLKRIEAAKDAKGAKKGKPLPPITDDEKLFNIPDSWVWVRLGDVCDFGKCESTFDSTIDDSAWTLDLEDIEKDTGNILQRVRHINRRVKSVRHVFKKGQVLFSKLRTYLNKVLIADEDGFCSSEIIPIDFGTCINAGYAKCLLTSPLSLQYTSSCDYGVKMPRLGTEDGRHMPFPLPPLAEQKRIVAKVEVLFKYVDECEDSRKQLAEKLAETLKRSVLQEAIQGRLVPQDPNDEPASELLKRIAAEREKQIAEKKIKKPKPLPPITDDEKPFPIPGSWEWVRLGELVIAESGLSYKKEDLSVSRDEMVRVLRGGNILDGKYVFKEDDVFIAKEFAMKRPSIKAFDFVLPAVTSQEHLGKTALFEDDQPTAYAGGFLLMFHLLYHDQWIARYLLAFFQSEQYHSYCKNIANKSGQAFYNLSREKLCLTPIPIPPLAEQKRIVAKVDSLLAKIEEVRAAVC